MEDEKVSILIVDDRPDKVLSLEAALEDLPLNTVRAYSGREALRFLLQQQFAVILLDVNMPGMDGFETALLIRQRKSTEHTPIIFITAYSDDIFINRGYQLGAVDYIAQPIVPGVLKTKVAVFVDLFRKSLLLQQQAQWQQRRAAQLQKLAAASIAVNSALSMEKMLQTVTDAARDIIGSHQAMTLFIVDPEHQLPQTETLSSFSEKYASWRTEQFKLDMLANTLMAERRPATRMSTEQLGAHPDWAIMKLANLPPIHGVLASPLIGRDGRTLGVLYLSDKTEGEFSEDDEAIITQLAQMAAVAVENAIGAEAREANRAKDQFLAVLSHELRTPLTPVLACMSELQNDKRIPGDVQEDLTMIRRNVELEARLIDDLLDLTRISKGKVALNFETIDAHALLHEALNICRTDISAKRLDLRLDLKAPHYHVNADITRLQQVFWNLIKNAVKFTPAGGQVNISSENRPEGHFSVAVSDTGIGIEADVLPNIFRAFEQGTQSITRQFGGLGLGLAISKSLMDLHKGALTAESAGTDQGATFRVSLPAEIDHVPAHRFPPPRLVTEGAPRRLRILLVEDHVDTARIMSKLLRGLKHEVRMAHSVAQAAEMGEAEDSFDLLISDIGLPDGSGLDLMRQICKRRPVTGIALSGFGMEDDIRKSKDAGFTEHLTKPINFQLLASAIDRVAARMEAAGPGSILAG